MAISTIYVLHGINTPTVFYSEVSNARVASGCTVMRPIPAGLPHPMFSAVQMSKPTVEFTTMQMAGCIDDFSLDGVDFSAGNVDLYEKKVAAFGTRVADATTVHNRYRMAEAFGYIESISAPHQGEATARCRIIPIYDGTNEPIVPAGSLALAGTPAGILHWGAGPVKINGTLLPGVQQIDIDFGVELIVAGGETEEWDTFVAIREIVPRITITTFTATNWTTYGLDGTALSSNGLEVWLRKKSADGCNVANATEEHILFTASRGLAVPEDNTGGNNNTVTNTMVFYPRAADATSHSITVDTTAAIS